MLGFNIYKKINVQVDKSDIGKKGVRKDKPQVGIDPKRLNCIFLDECKQIMFLRRWLLVLHRRKKVKYSPKKNQCQNLKSQKEMFAVAENPKQDICYNKLNLASLRSNCIQDDFSFCKFDYE